MLFTFRLSNSSFSLQFHQKGFGKVGFYSVQFYFFQPKNKNLVLALIVTTRTTGTAARLTRTIRYKVIVLSAALGNTVQVADFASIHASYFLFEKV